MPPKFWASSEDMSVDSSVDSHIDLSVDRVSDVARDTTSGRRGPEKSQSLSRDVQENNALARTMATSMSLPNLQPQQHASLFYLSLIEDRCRTQAVKAINAKRRQDDCLTEDHPEVCDLAEHLFAEMKRDLLKAGIIPQELASKSLPDLRLYLRSFDALLHNIAATKRNQDISVRQDYRALRNGSTHAFDGELSPSSDYSRALIRRDSNIDIAMAEPPLDPTILSLVSLNSDKTYPQSMYCHQYEEISMLGSGGEGAVYKAKYVVDRAEYAIKKVVIPAKKLRQLQKTSVSLSEKLKEVYALAKLNHPNVVRYHHSWIEFQKAGNNSTSNGEGDWSSSDDGEQPSQPKGRDRARQVDETSASSVPGEVRDSSESSSSNPETVSASKSEPVSQSTHQASYSDADDTSLAQEVENLNLNFSHHDLSMELGNTNTYSESYDDLIIFGNSSNAAPESQEESRSKKAMQQYNRPAKVNIDAVLYIKMTAYPSTLEEFLRNDGKCQMIPGHCFHILPTIRVLLAVIDGLQYVHRKNIIHQDLKPGNIFLSVLEDGEPATSAYVNIVDCPNCPRPEPVKPLYVCPHIGDFGMIREIKTGSTVEQPPTEPEEAESAVESGSSNTQILSSAPTDSNLSAYHVGDSFLSGTGFYKPPRIRGIKPIICPKRDCYALGAIALEMICQFGSKSERVHVFNRLREEGEFPREVRNHKLGECIVGMLQADREQRWTLERVKAFFLDMEARLR